MPENEEDRLHKATKKIRNQDGCNDGQLLWQQTVNINADFIV